MTDFDLDLSAGETIADLEELEGEYTTDREYRVSVGASYAKFLEFGAPRNNMPPYPFFRPAIREAQARGLGFIEEYSGVPAEEMDASDLVTALALGLQSQIQKNVTAQAAGGRSPGTHPEHPQIQSGTLRASVKSTRLR